MKKYARLLSASIAFLVVTIALVSCNDNNSYSLDKSWISIVSVNKLSNNTYDFTLDNGKKLWIATPSTGNLNPKYERAIINYTLLSDKVNGYDHYIRLNGYHDVLTKGVIYADPNNKNTQDSIGNHPIKVYAVWEGGGYLNIRFGYDAGGISKHMLNLVAAQPDLSVNDTSVKLEFRHNKNGDIERYPAAGYVSFDLTPYKIAGRDKVSFEIKAKDFDGNDKVYTVEYDYNSSGSKAPVIQTENGTLTSDIS